MAFDYLGDPQERHRFKNLPTTFYLEPEVIDDLVDVGPRLLGEDPQFDRFMREMDGCTSPDTNPC